MHRGVKNMTKEDREKALKCLKLSSIIGMNTLKTSKGILLCILYIKIHFKRKVVNALIETNYIDEFPLPIKEIIENDSNVELFTFKEFCNMTGYSLNELQTYGGSDEAFHIKKEISLQSSTMKMFIVEDYDLH